jgi:hypothetical protein
MDNAITSFRQSDAAAAERAESRKARHRALEVNYGSAQDLGTIENLRFAAKNYWDQCKTVLVCEKDEHRDLEAFYKLNPKVLEGDWFTFATDAVKNRAKDGIKALAEFAGDNTTKQKFLDALTRVHDKCELYTAANNKNFIADEGTDFRDEFIRAGQFNFMKNFRDESGYKLLHNNVVMMIGPDGQFVGSSNILESISPTGTPAISGIFLFIASDLRELGYAERLIEKRDEIAMNDFADAGLKDTLLKNGVDFFAEAEHPGMMDIGAHQRNNAGGTTAAQRLDIIGRLKYGIIEIGKSFKYIPYGAVPEPLEHLVPIGYHREIKLGKGGKLEPGERKAPETTSAESMYGNYKASAIWLRMNANPEKDDESGTARRELGYLKFQASLSKRFPVWAKEKMAEVGAFWDRQLANIRAKLGDGDLRDALVTVEGQQVPALETKLEALSEADRPRVRREITRRPVPISRQRGPAKNMPKHPTEAIRSTKAIIAHGKGAPGKRYQPRS